MKFIAFSLAFATFLAATMQQDAAASPASSLYCEEDTPIQGDGRSLSPSVPLCALFFQPEEPLEEEEPIQGDAKLTNLSLDSKGIYIDIQLRAWKEQPHFLPQPPEIKETPDQSPRPPENQEEIVAQKERKQKYDKALHDIATVDATWFYDEDADAKKMIGDHHNLGVYRSGRSREDDFGARAMRGKDYARAMEEGGLIPKGAGIYPRLIALCMINTLPHQADKDRWTNEIERLDKAPDTNNKHYYALMADIRRDVVTKQRQKEEEERAAREAEEKKRAAREAEERRLARARERLVLATLCILGGFVLAYAFYRLLKHLYTRYPSVKAYFRDLYRPHPATIVACALLIIPCIEQHIKDGRDDYYYFSFLRVAICSYAIIAAIQYYKKNTLNLRTLLAAAIAILYNPAFPVTRADYGEDWMQINIPSALLIYLFLRLKLPTKTPSGDA